MNKLEELKKKVLEFRDQRDWKQFHNPKDLAQALSIEASELLELFLWVSQKKSYDVAKERHKEVSDELADVLILLLLLSDATGIDLEKAFLQKIDKNAKKYPVEKSKGQSSKYTHL